MQYVGVSIEDVVRCYKYAQDMRGNHNNNMIQVRTDRQIFIDDLRGKLAEVAVKRYLENLNHRVKAIDFDPYPLGQWDKDDIVVSGNNNADIHVSVKSSGPKAKYLLIETFRFDANGECSYLNDDGTQVIIDKYAFVNVFLENEDEAGFTEYADGWEFLGTHSNSWDDATRRISCFLNGFITSDEFWANKKTAPRQIRLTTSNLDLIWGGQAVLPDIVNFVPNDRRWLQTTNYLINKNTLHGY